MRLGYELEMQFSNSDKGEGIHVYCQSARVTYLVYGNGYWLRCMKTAVSSRCGATAETVEMWDTLLNDPAKFPATDTLVASLHAPPFCHETPTMHIASSSQQSCNNQQQFEGHSVASVFVVFAFCSL
jgi:hypothetical protein